MRAAALLLAPVAGTRTAAITAQRHGRPLVLINPPDAEAGVCSVGVSHEPGGRLAVGHLNERGRRRLAFLVVHCTTCLYNKG